jgi:carbon-monoxide dehydrogenase small subunit
MRESIEFVLNNKLVAAVVDPLKRLVDVLREDCGLTGVKEGCGEGECGACSVLVEGRLVNSCITPVGTIAGAAVTTIEGFRETKKFEVLAAAFAQAGAVQCGYCTPGMLLAAEALLRTNAAPSAGEIRLALSGNLCRCTGYSMIVEAIAIAAKEGTGLW